MHLISSADMASWDRFYRANFVNSLTGFKSVSLIGTCNAAGQPNLAVFSSIVHLGSNPPLVGYINRPRAAAPHTLANIEATGFYTINHIAESFVNQAHQTSAKYPTEINEFDAVGLEAEWVPPFLAPFVKSSPVKYAMALRSILPIELNDTYMVIGEVQAVALNPDHVQPDGFIDLSAGGSLCSNGVDSYYQTIPVVRLPYAKP